MASFVFTANISRVAFTEWGLLKGVDEFLFLFFFIFLFFFLLQFLLILVIHEESFLLTSNNAYTSQICLKTDVKIP